MTGLIKSNWELGIGNHLMIVFTEELAQQF